MTLPLANTITADLGLIPGLAIISPLFGLPLSIMAAVIERPFLTAAGLRRHAVWYSIQANVASLLVGYPIVCGVALLTGLFGETALLLWPFAAVAISATVERGYLHARTRGEPPLTLGWVLAGNAVSALACLMLLFPVYVLNHPDVRNALRPYQLPLTILLGTFCLAAVVASFVVPRRANRSAAAITPPAPALSPDPAAV